LATVTRKWGEEILKAGYQPLPDILIRALRLLDLDALDLAVILNITLHWWEEDDLPYPRPAMIAKRIGVSTRTVERRLAGLSKKGLIRRLPSETRPDGLVIRRFDLSGLKSRLERLAEVNLAARKKKTRSSERMAHGVA